MTDLLFDARHIDQSGVGTYIRTQLSRLESMLAEHRRALTVLVDRDNAPAVGEATRVVFSEFPGAPMYSVDEQRAWDAAVRDTQPKALWVPHYPFPFTLLRRANRHVLSFVTVHDDNHLLAKDVSGQGVGRRLYARAMLEVDARRSSTVFSPTQAAAEALARFVPSAEFVVTPIPVGEEWLEPVDAGLSPVQGRYVLYLGNVKRHKNLPALLEAFDQVQQDVPQGLVIAGSGASVKMLDERVHAAASALGERVRMIGRLDFENLRALVAGADVLVMPSFNEGAGLPPLEAMASHTAVICSDIPSLRETCGTGADYFDPHDHRELATLIRTLCLNDSARAELTSRGWAHVTQRQAHISLDAAASTIVAKLDQCRV
ncbi:glycosyltransferase family 4 protein [Mycobacterium yunnanensis]|uniref:Glycosyltransferase family 4 protein n=1 Tax=Mycobacterium yunnanensis TaxID=368477 RepID=A0A9X3C344_9MYCO|nr:glycosyltransferase family 1 protein [Mycobacterium yunnanensis]MCV7421462.1 glycosyltransferase family 4 protein [Mycobacterium yunnanensis]